MRVVNDSRVDDWVLGIAESGSRLPKLQTLSLFRFSFNRKIVCVCDLARVWRALSLRSK